MIEYFTNALVLDAEDSGEFDKLIVLYSKDLGKVVAKSRSVRKITSKLAGHLQPLNFTRIRLVEKNGFQITDALALEKIKPSKEALEILQFIKEMTFELQPDKHFWSVIKKIFENLKNNKKISYRPMLKALGFAPDFSRCHICHSKFVTYFSKSEQIFLCRRCVSSHHLLKSAKQESFSDLIQI